LKQAKGQNEASIDPVASAISGFETYSNCKDSKAFHFKKYLAKQTHHKKAIQPKYTVNRETEIH
jgi:hypothetical protein|tara:strand:+ start:133 stop:324 length:192 start_codon:yes stop_codon:yes gene_type:complete